MSRVHYLATRFDIAHEYTKDKGEEEGQEALRRLLGWNKVVIVINDGRGKGGGDKESGHHATTGKIRNSNAREYLGEGEDYYRFMWEVGSKLA